MKGSIVIVSFFLLGVLLGRFVDLPQILYNEDVSTYVLFLLMFSVGVSIGCDSKALESLRHQNIRVIFVPIATIVGTLAGCAAVSLLLSDISLTDTLAVGSGFGYYSLSSIFITKYKGAELGAIALVSNIIREIITLLCAPLMVRWFGRLAPICSGGATTMDTTLPIITMYSGKEYVVVSIFHGFAVDFCVPFLVTLFCQL